MRKGMMIGVLAVLVAAGTTGTGWTAWGAEKTPEEYEKKIAELETRVKQLEGQGAEKGAKRENRIDLGRTSLAQVEATSVNGGRAMDNIHYGVLNCFDDGANWHNNINYTYWLSSGEESPSVTVRFDVPVTVEKIQVEQGPKYTARLILAEGAEQTLEEAEGENMLKDPAAGVKGVRLTFASGGANVKVSEIRILGTVPAGTEYQVQKPRVAVTEKNARLAAGDEFEKWWTGMHQQLSPHVEEKEGSIVVTYERMTGQEGGWVLMAPVYRVTVDRKTGKATSESLSELTERPGQTVEKRRVLMRR